MRTFGFAMTLFLGVGVAHVARADQADDLFKEGSALYDAGKYDQAYEKFHQAWDVRKSPDIAGNLAQAEIKVGKTRDAARHMAYLLRTLPTSVDAPTRKKAKDLYDGLAAKLCVLRVHVSDAGAMVIVGAERIGAAPLEDPVIVDPGHYVITAELAGREATPVPIDVSPGATQDVTVQLHPVAAPSSTKPIWPYFVGGSVAVVGAAIAIGGFVGAAGKQSDAQAWAKTPSCNPVSSACLSQGQTFENSRGTLTTLGIVGASVGGAALVATIVYAAVPSKSSSAEHAWLVVPAISPDRAALTVLGRFQ